MLESQVPVGDDDLFLLPYSSGTTGLPKGTILTHENLNSNLLQGLAFEGEVTGNGVFSFSPLPLFHIYGFNFSLHMVGMAGGTLVTVPRFDLERFCSLVQEYGIRRAQLVPPIIIGLAKSPVVEDYDLGTLETCYSAAAVGIFLFFFFFFFFSSCCCYCFGGGERA